MGSDFLQIEKSGYHRGLRLCIARWDPRGRLAHGE